MKVKDILPGMDRIQVAIRVVGVGEVTNVSLPYGVQRVCRCVAGDETGVLALILWNDFIKYAEQGSILQITRGHAKKFKGELQLATTRDSVISKVDDGILPDAKWIIGKYVQNDQEKSTN